MGGQRLLFGQRFRQKMTFKNAFMSETVLQSVVACKGRDNLWLELFTKEVHTSIIILSTAHDLSSFNHVYIGQSKISTHAIRVLFLSVTLCSLSD